MKRKYIKLIKVLSLLFFVMHVSILFAQQADTVVIEPEDIKNLKTVTGTILDGSTNQPVPGISLTIPGYSSCLTDDKGHFELKVPNYDANVLVTGEGFQVKEIALKGRKTLDITLADESFNSIYDVAYLPNGQKARSKTAESVTSLNTEEMFAVSAESPDNYLQGRVPGLNVIGRSGMPGIGANMFLRGFSSLYGTNKPLFVVDGMIYDMNDYGSSLIGDYFSNPLSYIDIKDIENISVIKDATGSIYGSKASNGVIMITTNHPVDLATKIDFVTYRGVNFAPKSIPVMEADDYRLYLSDILKSQGLTDQEVDDMPFMIDDPTFSEYYRYHNNTSWQDEVFDNSISQNYYLKVSGGDNIARYALSMGFLNHEGIIKNTDFNRYNTRFNADFNINPKLTASTNLAFTYNEFNLKDQGLHPKTNPVYVALTKAPFLSPHMFNEEGVLSPNLEDTDIFKVSNPTSIVENMRAESRDYRFFGSINFNYRFNDLFSASSLFGITTDKVRENIFIPRLGVASDTLINGIAESSMKNQIQRYFSLYNDTRFSFNKAINEEHHVSAMVGFRFRNNSFEEDLGIGYNSPTDELQSIGTGVNNLRQVTGQIGDWKWLNYYANIDYLYKNKYFLSFNLGVDGSSRFGDEAKGGISLFDKKFGVFPSVAGAWLISSESFMSDISYVEMLKLRISHGMTGNDDIGNYSAQQYYVSQNLLGMQGLIRGNIANPELQWESKVTSNIGVDIALFDERVNLSVDLYKNRINNMLTYEETESSVGLESIITNNGAMENKGMEVSVYGRVINKRDLKLDLGLNIGGYENKITKLPYERMITEYAGAYILTKVGKPVGLFYGYETDGVFASDEDAVNSGLLNKMPNGTTVNFEGGDVRFVDQYGGNIIDETDRVNIGDPNPDFTGMFNAHLEYLDFTFDAALTFVYGNDVYNYTRRRLESMSGYENQTPVVNNRWRAQGQETDIPKAVWGDPQGNSRFSDRWIEDGSYMRLSNVSLSYKIPLTSDLIKYIHVFATGNNLLTFSKYLGYDPEFSASTSILSQGIDTGMSPQYKSVMIGLRIGL